MASHIAVVCAALRTQTQLLNCREVFAVWCEIEDEKEANQWSPIKLINYLFEHEINHRTRNGGNR